MLKQLVLSSKKLRDYVDWKLLIFLILFLNIKLPLKIAGVLFIYALQFDFKFGFKLKNSRLPLFYLLIIPLALLPFIINKDYSAPNYLLVFFSGIGFWLLAILAAHQIKLLVEKNSVEVIHQTIIAFFILNALLSLGNLAYMMWASGSINPYTFRGMYQTYFINTGDNIKGITFDISSTNAIISAFGVFYFLDKQKPLMVLICMATMLLTYSNLVTIMLFLFITLQFIFKSTANQKSMIVVCIALLVLFMTKISPQNESYIVKSFQNILHHRQFAEEPFKQVARVIPITQKPDNILNRDEKRQKAATLYLDSLKRLKKNRAQPQHWAFAKAVRVNDNGMVYIPAADTTAESFYLSNEIEPDRKKLLDFIDEHKSSLPLSAKLEEIPASPGKITGTVQTASFIRDHPAMMITGLGIGNFSSKIAFRATGLGIRGQYPQGHFYISRDFLTNHLDLYLSFFSRAVAFRSVINNPFSVYDQLLTEYGFLGLFTLLIFYLGFFAGQYKSLSYGIPLLLFVCGIFFIDYWFEQLSVLIMFELMLFLNIKESQYLPKAVKNEQ